MMMVYKLTSIPDISLVKYKIMSGNGIDVLREWTDDFLRQWQKISAIYDIEINFIVKYSPENCDKDKLELYIVFKYENTQLIDYLNNLMKASQLSDAYKIEPIDYIPFQNETFNEKIHLKKCERKRSSDIGNDEKIDLFYVETWESNKNSRLMDLYKTCLLYTSDAADE